jgi:hypothetical protein
MEYIYIQLDQIFGGTFPQDRWETMRIDADSRGSNTHGLRLG